MTIPYVKDRQNLDLTKNPAGEWDIWLDPLTNGLARTYNEDQINQHVHTRLKMHRGEYAFDRTIGTPWRTAVFVTPLNTPLAESAIKAEILGTPGVMKLLGFDVSVDLQKRMIGFKNVRYLTEYGAQSLAAI